MRALWQPLQVLHERSLATFSIDEQLMDGVDVDIDHGSSDVNFIAIDVDCGAHLFCRPALPISLDCTG
jgi:hypothetical protein